MTDEELCTICQEKIFGETPFGSIVQKLPCGHTFHLNCIRKHIYMSDNCQCPNCRIDVPGFCCKCGALLNIITNFKKIICLNCMVNDMKEELVDYREFSKLILKRIGGMESMLEQCSICDDHEDNYHSLKNTIIDFCNESEKDFNKIVYR